MQEGRRKAMRVPLCHSLACFLETGSLTKSGGRLAVSKPQWLSCFQSLWHWGPRCLRTCVVWPCLGCTWVPGFELKSSSLQSNYSCPPSHPQPLSFNFLCILTSLAFSKSVPYLILLSLLGFCTFFLYFFFWTVPFYDVCLVFISCILRHIYTLFVFLVYGNNYFTA